MPYLVLGLAVLIGIFFAARWFAAAPPSQIARVLKWSAVLIFVPLTAILVLRGGAQFLFFLLPALLPWIMRARAAARMARNWQRMSSARAGGSGRGGGHQASTVETAFLTMELDIDSGEMDGEVRSGQFTGRRLADMELDALIQLLGECAADEQSAQVLMSYLDRYYPDDWRQKAAEAGSSAGASSEGGSASGGAMTRDEAYDVLGLQPGASEEQIKEAHRELMSKLHPDRGGSTYLATKINQAKDLLLGH